MEKLRLGKTKHLVSKVGLGTVQFGIDYGFTKKKSQQDVNEILSCADKNGINLIDTAREYGDSEEKIGRFISQNTNSFIIATKLERVSPEAGANYNSLRDKMYNSVETSLKYLNLDQLSLLQLHQTDDYLISNAYFWEIIRNLKNESLIDSFGISVYNQEETKFLINNYHNLIDFFQIPYNVFDRRFDDLAKQFCENSIGTVSRSTFLKGMIPCSLGKLPNDLKELSKYKVILSALAEKLSMKVEELALLFVYHNRTIESTILGVDSSKELYENISIINRYNSNILSRVNFDDLAVNDATLIDPRQWINF